MESNTHATTETALLGEPRTRSGFDTAKNSIKASGALSALALLTVIAVSSSGHMVNTFMWVRAVLLSVFAVLIYRMIVSASRGSRRAFERVNALAVIMPIAIIGIDLIPGSAPCGMPRCRASAYCPSSEWRSSPAAPPCAPPYKR